MRRFVVALPCLLAACGSAEPKREPAPAQTIALPGARGAAIELTTSREREEIARLEDARSLGGGRLLEVLASDRDPGVRERAAMALSRFAFPRFGADVTTALVRALEDPVLEVRRAAAFALGERADPASAGTLQAYRNDPEPSLRARVVEAASKLDDATLHAQVALSLRDSDLSVRMEAAVGTARWSPRESNASDVNRALLDALSPYRITRDAAPKSAIEAELVWRILWALGRRGAELGLGPFLEYARSSVPLERLYALRGLGQLEPDPASLRAAVGALVGPDASGDWRVAYEAVNALGRMLEKRRGQELGEPGVLPALEKAVEHASTHVRAAAMDALGALGDRKGVLTLLQRGRLDLSAGVRAAALRARVRLSAPDEALEELRRGAREDDPVLRVAAVDAAVELGDPRGAGLLLTLARDPSLFVATHAIEKLAELPSEATRAELRGFLAHTDNGIRLAAILALKVLPPSPEDASSLAAAFASSVGDVSAEVAFNALQALARIGTPEARAVVEAAQTDPRAYVRSVARKAMRESFGLEPSTEEPPANEDTAVPIAGKDYPLYRFNPLVELTTSRGSMVFELFPAEAPVHVQNFLSLVRARQYDGLTIHRVVPDFVVQGGDYRGDGNGARPFRGDALRAEFTPRKYTRGSLGMPRNEDPDSGGSQFFVTHVPTPHLDGRYTLFGELRTGGEVLDRLEVGDRILSARVIEER